VYFVNADVAIAIETEEADLADAQSAAIAGLKAEFEAAGGAGGAGPDADLEAELELLADFAEEVATKVRAAAIRADDMRHLTILI
jgi:hypothetical protein